MAQLGEKSLLERLNLRVEQLDYAFVRECEDASVLERVLRVLLSGQEGFYPHLIEYVEGRLVQVRPESRLLLRPHPPTRPQDLPRSELAALEADLAAWAADLRREEGEKRTGKRREEEEEEEEDEEEVFSPQDHFSYNTRGALTPSNKVIEVKGSRDTITRITGGHKSAGSLITDLSEPLAGHASFGDLKNTKRSPGSLIEVMQSEGQESPGTLRSKVKVMEEPEPVTISHVSGGSVIKVTLGHGGGGEDQRSSSRQVEGMMREAERQQAEGDLLSASLTYNKVLSMCPQQAQARHALASLLRGGAPAEPGTAPAATPVVYEVE